MIILLFLFCAGVVSLRGQDYFRIRADFTLKEISSLGDSTERRLVIGTCYYDKTLDKLTYNLSFPEPEQWIIADSFIYTLQDGQLLNRAKVPPLNEHNVFRMLLDQTFSEFGMMKSGYEVDGVKKIGDQVYLTYLPPEKYADVLGSLVLIKERKKLNGVIYYEPDGNMMFRQQLDDYEIVDGLPVPKYLSHIIEKDGKKIKRILSFENIAVNESGHDHLYNTPLDLHGQ